MDKRPQAQSITKAQKEMLVRFMSENPKLVAARFSPEFTLTTAQKLWQGITKRLNNVPGGAKKDHIHWRKSWQDLRTHIKKKALAAASRPAAAAVQPSGFDMAATENIVLEMIGFDQINGLVDPLMQDIPLDAFDHNNEDVEEKTPRGASVEATGTGMSSYCQQRLDLEMMKLEELSSMRKNMAGMHQEMVSMRQEIAELKNIISKRK